MTIFGALWTEVKLEHVQEFLDQADDEPLLWEAKGTKLERKEVRRQACAFANSHEGGYLILGAERAMSDEVQEWRLDGVPFPGGEPRTWVADVISDPERGVRPRPDFDVRAWPVASGHVAVVRVASTSTPPCMTNGTVYERLPGKTQTVSDPVRLADLFSRGDEARNKAQACADRAAEIAMEILEGAAGEFHTSWTPAEHAELPNDAAHIRYAVGVTATGNSPDIASRLFRDEFAEAVWGELRDRPTGLPPPFAASPDPVDWSQDALMWRRQTGGLVNSITVVRASWDGAVAVGRKIATEDVYIDSLAEHQLAPDWRLADQLIERLGGFGDSYTTVLLAGGRFPRRKQPGWIMLRRGPLLPGVDDRQVASLGRELMRAVGNSQQEP